MESTQDLPIFTVQSVVQGLASDSALLLSLVTTVERTATLEQKVAFARHFVSLLLRCRDESIFAGSELLGELLLLDLDEAMWHQRDAAVFLRHPSTIVSSLLKQLSQETFTSPEGSLLPHLVTVMRVLSAGDDASTSSIATSTGASLVQWSHHSDDGLLALGTPQDGTSVYDRFSTSELAGLSTAEQQFLGDMDHSPQLMHSLLSSVGYPGMDEFRSPQQADLLSPSQPRPPSQGISTPYGFNDNGSVTTTASSCSGWCESLRDRRDTDPSSVNCSRPPTRTAFTGTQIREAVDFFSGTAAVEDPKGVPNTSFSLSVVDVRAEAVLSLAFQIQDVVARHISDCPLVLRRAFWLWLRAASGRSGPSEFAEISPELHMRTVAGAAHKHQLPVAPSVIAKSSQTLSFEFFGMATMVMLHMLTPLLLSIPSFVLPVEEDENSEAYVTTTARFRFITTVLQKAAYGVFFDEKSEAGLAPLNRGMRELHRRWVSCFSALADYRNASSMNWCCPLPSPTRGVALSVTRQVEEQAIVQRYFQFLDGFLVPYLQTTVLLRRFTEPIHLPQWLRCTCFGTRFARGQLGGVCTAAAPLPSPQPLGNAESIFSGDNGSAAGASVCSTAMKKDASEGEKLQRMATAVSHVVAGLSTATYTGATPEVSAFMANFISFLGTNSATVTILVIYEDLLWRYWAQFPQSHRPVDAAASIERGEAAAVLAFYIYLAVQHNVVGPHFQLVLIPSVSAALCSEGQQAHFGSFGFSTADTMQWIWQVFEDLPVSYRRLCDRIWTATISSVQGALALEQPKSLPSIASHMPRWKVCSSFSELMACLFKGLSSYIPLSADDYHWMVCEQRNQKQLQVASLSAAHFTADMIHIERNRNNEDDTRGQTEVANNCATPALQRHRSSVSTALANTATLRSLRARWRRPLAVSESLSASGILPLHSTRALFEVLCTITCRRLWIDGTLQPMAGVNSLGTLLPSLCRIAQLYGVAVDVAATLLVAVDATPPPRWLRDLHFSHGSVSVHVEDVDNGNSASGATPTASNTSLAAMQQIDKVHWPHCAWFYPIIEEDNKDDASSVIPQCTQWESLMQHVLFFSSEFEANVPDYDVDSNMAEQILSTRWGLSSDVNGRGAGWSSSAPLSAPAAEECGSPSCVTAALTSLHAVPSLRHLSVESLWRIFLFNTRQTCHIMRRMTPRECPFCRMEGAIANVLCGDRIVRKSPIVAVRPCEEDGIAPLSERISQAAADALRSCFPSEVTIVRLIVSVAAYVRNVYTIMGRLRESGAAVPASMTPAKYEMVVRAGTTQLLYGKAPLTAAQERLVDLLCFDGDSLIRKAYLPYYENCAWHPYGRLMYDC